MEEQILFEGGPEIYCITLNRPLTRNALSMSVLNALGPLFEKISAEPKIRALIITGAGDKAFCAGADLKERQAMSIEESLQFVKLIQLRCDQLARLPIPTIAAINGDAFGGGLELALACDLRLLATNAHLGLTECSLGIIPGAGGTQRLPRLVGIAKACELIFLAKRLTAPEALSMGLVNSLCEEGLLVKNMAIRWAESMAQNAPLALRAAKKALYAGLEEGIKRGLELEFAAYKEIIGTNDRNEGLKAFMEKRAPRFRGN